MKNLYFIINKQPNQTWEQWEKKRTEGEEITIPWSWKFDRARKAMKRYKKKGLCKQIRGYSGMDTFKWVGNAL